jgi:hypothetical protein
LFESEKERGRRRWDTNVKMDVKRHGIRWYGLDSSDSCGLL